MTARPLGRRDLLRLLAAAPLAAAPGCSRPAGPAVDLVVRGGKIWTMDPRRPEVDALAAAGGRVVAVGGEAEVLARAGPGATVIDLAGGLAVPGLTDAHAHLLGLGAELDQVDLRGAGSLEEVVARVRERAPAGDGWVLGRGWDQNLWPGAAMPTHAPLTAAFPDRPVWLRRVDGHAGWANQAALTAAGITASTPAPQGGEILLHDGAPSGVLVDAAMALMPVPGPDDADLRRRILAAQARALACGLCGVHEMGVDPRADALLRELANAGELKLRVTGYAEETWFKEHVVKDMPSPPGADYRYGLVGVKTYVDGALGSRGAALLAEYDDRPGHLGMLQHAPGELRALIERAHARGWQVAAHAIGDRAIRELLDAYEAVVGPAAPAGGPGLRVEHAQIVDLADIPRFARLGAVASMQPTHATSDMPWAGERVGERRLAGAYAWRRFLDAGAALAFGSDFPVELPDVTHGLYAAISRRDAAGHPPEGWLPDQVLTLDEAVRAFTRGAAHAARQDAWAGVLAPGFAADLTCFRVDLRAVPLPRVRDAPVLATIVGGAVAWRT